MITSGFLSACKQFHSEVNITTTDDEESGGKIDSYSSLTRGILPGEFYVYYLLPYIYIISTSTGPGTLWCGVNDIADDYSHLGQLWRLDTCCRQHDFCPVKVRKYIFDLQQIFFIFFCRLSRYSHDRVSSTCPRTPSPTAAATRFSMTA